MNIRAGFLENFSLNQLGFSHFVIKLVLLSHTLYSYITVVSLLTVTVEKGNDMLNG